MHHAWLRWGPDKVVLSNSTHFDLLIVTLTFEVQALVLRATCCLIIVNVCAKFHGNPIMHGLDAGRTSNSPIKQYSFWPLTSKWYLNIWGEHVCLVTRETNDAWLRCEPDKVVLLNSTHFDLWPLSHKVRHAASSWWTYVPSFFEILRCTVEMGAGQGSPIKYYSFWPLTSKCDLDIWGTGLGFEHDTPPHHGERLC